MAKDGHSHSTSICADVASGPWKLRGAATWSFAWEARSRCTRCADEFHAVERRVSCSWTKSEQLTLWKIQICACIYIYTHTMYKYRKQSTGDTFGYRNKMVILSFLTKWSSRLKVKCRQWVCGARLRLLYQKPKSAVQDSCLGTQILRWSQPPASINCAAKDLEQRTHRLRWAGRSATGRWMGWGLTNGDGLEGMDFRLSIPLLRLGKPKGS